MIDKEKVFKQYIAWVNKICDEEPNRMAFAPKEIVYKICDIIDKL